MPPRGLVQQPDRAAQPPEKRNGANRYAEGECNLPERLPGTGARNCDEKRREPSPDERLRRAPWKAHVQAAPQLSRTRRSQATDLADLMSANGTLWIHRRRIAAVLEVSARAVDRLVAALLDAGYLVQTGEQAPNIPARFVGVNPLIRTLPTRDTPRRMSTGPEGPEVARVQASKVSPVDASDQREHAPSRAGARTSSSTRNDKDRIDGGGRIRTTGNDGDHVETTDHQVSPVPSQHGGTRVRLVTTEGSGSSSARAGDLGDAASRAFPRRRAAEGNPDQIPLPLIGAVETPRTPPPDHSDAVPHLDALTDLLDVRNPVVREALAALRDVAQPAARNRPAAAAERAAVRVRLAAVQGKDRPRRDRRAAR